MPHNIDMYIGNLTDKVRNVQAIRESAGRLMCWIIDPIRV
jgi:hypothetical protein